MSYPQVYAAKRLGFYFFLISSLFLAGCGSDDDDNTSSSSSVSSVSVSVSSSSLSSSSSSSSAVAAIWPDINITATQAKTLNIQWDAVADATFYRVLKDADGASGFTQLGDDLTATETTDNVSVHLYNWQNARYMIEACNDAGCSASNEAGALQTVLSTIGFIKASNTDPLDWFGWSLALSSDGTTLAVGATQEDSLAQGVNGNESNNENFAPGAVYIYTLNAGVWSQQAYLKASNTEQFFTDDNDEEAIRPNDRFGYSVSLSDNGNTLAVGALLEDSNATGINGDEEDNKATDAGAVYIFERSEASWLQTAYVKASNTPEEEDAASADDNSDDAEDDSDNNDDDDDELCIEDETTEELECEVDEGIPSNTGDRFGYAVALSGDGNTLAVGSIGEDSDTTGINGNEADNSLSTAGATYVFARTTESWEQQAYIKSSNPQAGDLFGSSVSLSTDGNTLAIGAYGENRGGTGINGPFIIATTSTAGSGSAYVFRRTDATWVQGAYIKTTHTTASQFFGFSLSLAGDGNTLAVAAYGEGSKATGLNGDPSDYADPTVDPFPYFNSGAAYIFEYSDTQWQQVTYIKASNSEPNDKFGHHISLSKDGLHLAVGAYFEDGAAIGINGDESDNNAINAGAVYLFSKTQSTWQQDRYIKSKAADINDRFGHNIALSANGGTLAISAYRESSDAKGINGDAQNNEASAAGAVYLY